MPKFKVYVNELVINNFEIEAKTENDAKEIAKNITISRNSQNELNPAPSIDKITRTIIETNCEKIKPKCTYCNDTGIMKYHEIDGMTIFHWQPYKTRSCEYCKR